MIASKVSQINNLSDENINTGISECWTLGAIFTLGRSRMLGPEKLRPLAVGRSQSRRIKNRKTYVIKFLPAIIPTK